MGTLSYGKVNYLLVLLPPAVCASGLSAGATALSGSALGAALGPAVLVRACWGFWPAVAAIVGAVELGAAAVASPAVAARCPVSPCPALRGLVWPTRLVVALSKQC